MRCVFVLYILYIYVCVSGCAPSEKRGNACHQCSGAMLVRHVTRVGNICINMDSSSSGGKRQQRRTGNKATNAAVVDAAQANKERLISSCVCRCRSSSKRQRETDALTHSVEWVSEMWR